MLSEIDMDSTCSLLYAASSAARLFQFRFFLSPPMLPQSPPAAVSTAALTYARNLELWHGTEA